MGLADVSVEQVRNFRLRAHRLDRAYGMDDVIAAAGACGMQNTPPGAWEAALFNRVSTCGLRDMERLLDEDRVLVQAWSMRGAPVVFPTSASAAFLGALVPQGDEPWIYTKGIGLALDALGMAFEELLDLLVQVMPKLDDVVIASKVTLDQTLADWVEPLLPAGKRAAWREPSMYGSPDKQTVGGAAVSFLLRPCAFLGLIVFGARDGASPTFTSYRRWTGRAMRPADDAAAQLVRMFLRCYGPARPDALAAWLGCSGAQARRLWASVEGELAPVTFGGKRAWVLAEDVEGLAAPEPLERDVLLLAGHDPYLDQRDRATLQANPILQRKIWRTVANPGVVVRRGEAVGTWTPRKKGAGVTVACELWDACPEKTLRDLAERYAAFRGQKLLDVTIETV